MMRQESFGECTVSEISANAGDVWSVAYIGDVTTGVCETPELARLTLNNRLETLRLMLLKRMPITL